MAGHPARHNLKEPNLNIHPILGLRLAAAASLAAPLLLAAGCSSSEAATAAASPGTSLAAAPHVTAILVHGAWADGSSWSRVTPILQARGVDVVSVQLRRASLAEDAAIVQRAIADQKGKVVLVGHSYGGAAITEGGNDAKVGALVYVAAFAPGDGESINDLVSPYPAGAWQAGLVPDSAGFLRLGTEAFLTYFAADLPRDEAAVLATSQGPIFAHVLQDKVSNAAWKSKPSYWALSANDQIIPAAFQQGQAARIKAKVTTISGGHTELLSHPQEVAAVVMDAVEHLR
jgi:pimeloyl-ACP methyl ester carboxylesterase